MTLETNAWGTVRRALSPYGFLQRVETGTGLGVPDVCYCLRAVTGWLELKTDLAKLTLEQVLWHEGWARAGGRVFMLYYDGEAREWYVTDHALTRRVYGAGGAAAR